jgi:hypothetical protein
VREEVVAPLDGVVPVVVDSVEAEVVLRADLEVLHADLEPAVVLVVVLSIGVLLAVGDVEATDRNSKFNALQKRQFPGSSKAQNCTIRLP